MRQVSTGSANHSDIPCAPDVAHAAGNPGDTATHGFDEAQGENMANLVTARAAEQVVLADRKDLERQFRIAERHYAHALATADQARDQWRALLTHPESAHAQVSAARARFEAVAARCDRLRVIIDKFEERLDY
jgi:hypothetical protein